MPEISTSGTDPVGIKALYTTAVWGRAYVDRFLNYSLRTQLSEGNLGAFGPDSLYLLFTDAADVDYVTSSEAYKALSRIMQTECLPRERITKPRHGDKYAKLTACQNHALWKSGNFDAIFFGYGDALWADGSYRAAARRLQEGYDAVFGFGYPVNSNRFVSAAKVFDEGGTAQAVSIAPRAFSQHVCAHLHPMAHANNWNNKHMGPCSSYVMWDVPGEGYLLRSFHLHPIAVRVLPDNSEFFAPFRSTLDEEFVARLYRFHPRVYVCTSSDELGVCSLAEDSHDTGTGPYELRPPSVGILAEFAEGYAGLMHRELFRHSIRLTTGEVHEERWRAAEEQAAAIEKEIERRLAAPDGILALEHPAAYQARMRRQTVLRHMSPYGEELYRKVTGGDHARGSAASRSAKGLGRGIVYVLHATRATRAFRLYVLPRLNWRQRLWFHELLTGLGINAPLIKSEQGAGRLRGWGLWRWLWSWIRVHA